MQTCIVIGNGPSLKDVPNEWLDKYPTFGTNRIFLKYQPTYYVAINPLVVRQNLNKINEMNCSRFVRANMGAYGSQLHSSTIALFSYEPLVWVNEGYTVTYVCLQLAYWMGFEEVLLVGVDHRYQYEGKPNQTKRMEGDDPNHFDPAYFRGMDWQNPDLKASELYYKVARAIYEADGRRIINMTPNTALEVFECEPPR